MTSNRQGTPTLVLAPRWNTRQLGPRRSLKDTRRSRVGAVAIGVQARFIPRIGTQAGDDRAWSTVKNAQGLSAAKPPSWWRSDDGTATTAAPCGGRCCRRAPLGVPRCAHPHDATAVAAAEPAVATTATTAAPWYILASLDGMECGYRRT
ncbi:hypothetical protein Tco_0706632 [Tanacetum coccineum]|uniref:Uncharacterized protein n=1 Tax=Tanacetum coccineum TaxID=301880 RepID=A0ABQ4Y8X1_9ASTR